MPGLTNAESQATLDARFPTSGATDHIAYSTNGTSETASLGRTAIGATGWSAATSADPSVKANANALTSPAATGAISASNVYYSIYSAASNGTQRTDWTLLTADDGSARTFTLAIGDQLTHGVGKVRVTLT